MDTLERLRTADEAYNALNPDLPLRPGDPRWVDLNPVRGGDNLIDLLTNRIVRSQIGRIDYLKQLVTGHVRSGKTTELFRLQRALEDRGFCVVYFDVLEELGADVSYIHVLIATAEQIAKQAAASKWKVEVKPDLLQALVDWFSEVIITQEKIREADRTLQTDYGLGLQTPVAIFAKMFATFRGQIRNSSQRREEIKQRVEKDVGLFIERLNDLVDDAQARLHEKGSSGLVLIVDSLEKMLDRSIGEGERSVSTHIDMFIHHGEQLKAPRCHAIYTVPITLLSDRNVNNVFEFTEVIPMVKVAHQDADRSPYQAGREKLYEVIARRVDVDALFQPPNLLWRLIDFGGGHVGELLSLIRYALDYTDAVIGEMQVERAVRRVINMKDRLVSEDNLSSLVDIYQKQEADVKHAHLLYNLLALEYMNDKRWADVHPAVRANPRFQAMSAPKPKKRRKTASRDQ